MQVGEEERGLRWPVHGVRQERGEPGRLGSGPVDAGGQMVQAEMPQPWIVVPDEQPYLVRSALMGAEMGRQPAEVAAPCRFPHRGHVARC